MNRLTLLGSLALASGVLASVPAFADDAMAQGPCAVIATAKYQQWRQPILQVERSKTFGDGTTVNDKLIVTWNTAYKLDGNTWTSAGITLRERAVPSAEKILSGMKLASCEKTGTGYEAGQPATSYTLTYLPDGHGFVATGKIWISDMTGLPLREEFNEPAPPANQRVAKAISATYTYNSDVHIPREAEVAEARRLWDNASVLRNFQSGGVGAQQ